MAAMDHRDRDGICIWCHNPWPCPTALIRRELAAHIRRQPVGETGEAGRDSAADSIDVT